MKAPISWLQDFVKIDIPAEALADKLVHAGFEVEEIIREADAIKNVVTGRVLAMERHPNSDHLWICQINVKTATLQIVTGAQNVQVGDIVPVALDGAVLPDGKRIFNGELRGVKSLGMLCGGSELGLTDADYEGADVDGILILKPDTKVGVDINEILGRTDVILDVSVTANRPDCNSIWGIAREVGAVLHKTVKAPVTSYTATPERIFNLLDVQVADADLCPRYMAKAVKNIKICESPKIIKDRLRAVGIKPINNIVDITNYILIELGQPMHAFDYEKIAGHRIVVRRAEEGETITTLDNTTHNLDNDVLVIADAEKPLAVAGIMGGLDSGISDDTHTIIFESAKFARDNVRRTSRKLNLKSDSSARFEKGIDFLSQAIAIDRALTLIQTNGWGTIISGTIDTNMNAVKPRTLTVPYKKINNILGIKVPTEKMVEILNSLQIKTVVKGKRLECQIPAYREDIEGANDLAEEIIRLYGYNKIKSTLFADASKQTMGGRDAFRTKEDLLKRILTAKGANEIITYSFISPKTFDILRLPKNDALRNAIPILNPLGEDVSIMRTTLVGSMLSIIGSNFSKNNKDGIFFETSKVFAPK
ncbi:MAG: phenylalanine--tRNA ligase subunit beta, partial [Clostridiales bacterium]|nr:phenylalanine--tRNA ligase subunit beta [Clostridiales bacterium]